MLVYRAQPIDRGFARWRGQTVTLDGYIAAVPGVLMYKPEAAWVVATGGWTGQPDPRLEAVNREALYSADAVVAYYPDAPTLGVGREIEAARERDIPVMVMTDADRTLWAVHDCDVLPLSSRQHHELQTWIKEQGERSWRRDTLQFALVHPEAKVPTRTHPGDAGYDLFTSEPILIPPGEFRDVPIGVRAVFPHGVWGRITGRSSTLRRRGLLVAEGVVDQDYTGPLFAGCWNLTSEPVVIEVGERVAQMVLQSVVADRFASAVIDESDIPDTARGQAGFGSSGS
jgi:dUTP pyrophosphatase